MNTTKYVAVLAVALLAVSWSFSAVLAGSGDENHYTNGEDGHYEENNNNPFPDEEFPGEEQQQRSGKDW
ncbi:MAG TPA: hypothetical protein ENN54_03395 [Thermoplasmatales archaeon]|nr:hypothetical protein [Candidatus Thermoplasmatota archaeon]MDD5778589.1 hypothetical protein [Candidatus Thermoplasmatota archaeon]HDS59320.1 hypothetical protein [Thermoplasmatales archaeon]